MLILRVFIQSFLYLLIFLCIFIYILDKFYFFRVMSFFRMALLAKCKGVGVARRVPVIGVGEQQVNLLEEPVAEVVSENLDGEESLEWKKSLGYVDLNLMSCLSVSTRSAYSYWWKRFNSFCVEAGRVVLPCSSMTVAAFLSFLAENSDGLGGVDNARAAVRFFWKLEYPDEDSPTDSFRVSSVVKGIKRRFAKPVNKKKPLRADDFVRLLSSVTGGNLWSVSLTSLRFAAQLSVMYCTFARYEEVAALTVEQILVEAGDVVVMYAKGKQYQNGEAREGVMPSQPHLDINPVEVLRVYVERLADVGGSGGNILFPALISRRKKLFTLGRPASYESVLHQFRAFAKIAKVEGSPEDYGLHSLRRGAVTTSINNGCVDHVVSKQMRVAGVNTVHRYATLDRAMLAKAVDKLFEKC